MKKIIIPSKGFDHAIDVTEQISTTLAECKTDGIAKCCVVGSTAGLIIMRYEEGAIDDLFHTLEAIAPQQANYRHFETTKDPNGASHIKSSLIGESVSFPIVAGKIAMSDSHRIVLLDFDLRSADRTIYVDNPA